MRVGVAESPNAAGRADAPLVESAVFGAGTSGATNRPPGVDAPEVGRGRTGDDGRLRPGDPLPQDARQVRSARAWAEVCDQVELELARAPPRRVGVAAGELIGDLVFMRDAMPASLGRRRGPTPAVASA